MSATATHVVDRLSLAEVEALKYVLDDSVYKHLGDIPDSCIPVCYRPIAEVRAIARDLQACVALVEARDGAAWDATIDLSWLREDLEVLHAETTAGLADDEPFMHRLIDGASSLLRRIADHTEGVPARDADEALPLNDDERKFLRELGQMLAARLCDGAGVADMASTADMAAVAARLQACVAICRGADSGTLHVTPDVIEEVRDRERDVIVFMRREREEMERGEHPRELCQEDIRDYEREIADCRALLARLDAVTPEICVTDARTSSAD